MSDPIPPLPELAINALTKSVTDQETVDCALRTIYERRPELFKEIAERDKAAETGGDLRDEALYEFSRFVEEEFKTANSKVPPRLFWEARRRARLMYGMPTDNLVYKRNVDMGDSVVPPLPEIEIVRDDLVDQETIDRALRTIYERKSYLFRAIAERDRAGETGGKPGNEAVEEFTEFVREELRIVNSLVQPQIFWEARRRARLMYGMPI